MHLAAPHPDGVPGFADERWWSRLAHPALHSWTTGEPLWLVERVSARGAPEPIAVCCYGVLRTDDHAVLLRYVSGRPVSHVTTAFLAWVCTRLAWERKRVRVLIWDNVSWHMSQAVRTWIRQRNQQVTRDGGVRLLTCHVPLKRPWLNPIEPHWIHSMRAIVEPDRLLTTTEVMSRVYACCGADHVAPLTQKVA
jgi:hypothetical protein